MIKWNFTDREKRGVRNKEYLTSTRFFYQALIK